AVGVGVWAGVTAAHLDLDAAERTSLVFAAGRALKPGLAIRAVDESLDRLAYREVSGVPAQPGEFRRTRAARDIYLRSHDDVASPARRVRLDVQGSRVVDVADPSGAMETPDAVFEPELLTGVGATGQERRRPLALTDMSPFIVDAVLAAEDRRFF